MELEWRPGQPLMLKEWLELESSAELSRDGFGCYPRQLAAELRSRRASCRQGRGRNGHVVARVSAAVRAALSRQAEPAALTRSLSRTLRVVGFRKKRKGGVDRTVDSCSATAASSGRQDGTPSPAMSPRSMGWESRQAGGTGLGGGRRSHDETVKVEGCDECAATCRLDEEAREQEQEQEQRLSPVSVMDFPSQDGDDDDCNDDHGGSNGHNDDGGTCTSPTFEWSLANIRRASQELRQRIRQFEQLAELDTSDADDTSCRVEDELDLADDAADDAGCVPAQDLPGLPDASSPCAAHCFKKLLQDFFREGLTSRHAGGPDDDPGVEEALLDGRRRAPRSDDGKAEVEEIERLGRWRCFSEDEQEPLSYDVEDSIFWSLVDELVEELC